MMDLCPVCNAQAPLKCSACHAVSYCSTDHQKVHWKIHRKDCSNYSTAEAEFGEGFVASKDLKAGAIVLEDSPVIMAPCWDEPCKMQHPCVACGQVKSFSGAVRQCSKCSWPVCGVDCEKRGVHSENECKVFEYKNFDFPPGFPMKPDNIMSTIWLIRSLTLKQKQPEIYEKILELQSDFSIPGHYYKWELEVMIVQSLMDIASFDVNVEEMKKLLRIFRINCFTAQLVDLNFNVKGVNSSGYLYLKPNRMNHSCAPNCTWEISPEHEYKIRICTTVPVNKGEPLTIDYLGGQIAYNGTKQRQLRLLKMGFECKCMRCVDPTELGTYMSGITCAACRDRNKEDNVFGYLLPEDPLNLSNSARWSCSRCSNVKMASEILPVVENIGEVVSKRSLDLGRKRDDAALIKFYNSVINKYSGKFLHPNHWVLQHVTRVVFDFLTAYRKGTMDLSMRQFYVKCGMYLLAIQDVVTPGFSGIRAHLQDELAYSVHCQIDELVTLKRYAEVIRSFQLCDEFATGTLNYNKTLFLNTEGSSRKIQLIRKNMRQTEENKVVILAKIMEGSQIG